MAHRINKKCLRMLSSHRIENTSSHLSKTKRRYSLTWLSVYNRMMSVERFFLLYRIVISSRQETSWGTYKDADTQIFILISYCAKRWIRKVAIRPVDSDVVIILLGHFR